MPWNNKNLAIVFLIALFFTACVTKKISYDTKVNNRVFEKVEPKPFELEDFYIMYALEMENERVYYEARDVYFKLFEHTNKYEYLVNSVSLATQLKDFVFVEAAIAKYLRANIKEEEILLRLYSFAQLKLDKVEEASKNAEKLVALYPNELNYDVLATIYLTQKEYQKAHDIFSKAFAISSNAITLSTIANLEFFQLNRQQEAVSKLEDNLKKYDYDFNLSLQLIAFYEILKDEKKIEYILKEMFFYYRNNDSQLQLNNTKTLFWKYIKKDHIIDFWEENREKDDILVAAYRTTNQPQKAKDLLKELYEESQDKEILAELAIVEFDMAPNKKDIVPSVIEKLEIVLQSSNNHIYQNFLAYLLIDYELDIKKGVDLVKKALEQDAENIAYLDTLAWGEYKLKNCKTAYSIMKKIIDEVGLEDEELKQHWEKIKECK
ncbi:tetratricopeptide repeat protein [Aliarcobacter faecis]|uniref:hypothetical protein n=1 Tax=Aliarcobacter faecis TaxID=1564138 RepID=UPI00047BAFB9|nr:hypothetical protein [Aliarcobacter faecis]QKF73621.1 tetratricopeptide repeat protein [Aliarcobacter faecis]